MIEYAEALKHGTLEFFSEIIRGITKSCNAYGALIWHRRGETIKTGMPYRGAGTVDDLERLLRRMSETDGLADEIVASYGDKESETVWIFWVFEETIRAKKFKASKIVGRSLFVDQIEDAETDHLEKFKRFVKT